MGLLNKVLGIAPTVEAIGNAVKNTTEVFHVNETEEAQMRHSRFERVVDSYTQEFDHGTRTWFDGLVDGLNRLPRPIMALGTVGLFAYAMINPDGFSARMIGLALVPEPLWWLLGSIVGFYFGARELHHFRMRRFDPMGQSGRNAPVAPTQSPASTRVHPQEATPTNPPPAANDAMPYRGDNRAIQDWVSLRG